MISVKLKKAATTAVVDYMGLTSDETFMVITDEKMNKIGEALYEAAQKVTKTAFMLYMPILEINGDEPPNQLIDIMRSVDVIAAATSKSIIHTGPRHQATKGGVRVASIPMMEEESFIRIMSAEIDQVVAISNELAASYKDVNEVHITTDLGTDLKLIVKEREPIVSTGMLQLLGAWGNLPSGEVYIAPIEDQTEGIIVIDGTIAEIGLLDNPITIEISKGKVQSINGKGVKTKALVKLLDKYENEEAKTLAEFGIGTNYKAQIGGFIGEDEKVLGTCHFAFGNNFSFGGSLTPPIHLDCVIMKPTIKFDGKEIMVKGNYVVPKKDGE
jgi:aminopeptidase